VGEHLEWVVFEVPGKSTWLLPGHFQGLFMVHVSFLVVSLSGFVW
jgi:hypothetical protein